MRFTYKINSKQNLFLKHFVTQNVVKLIFLSRIRPSKLSIVEKSF